ncbi:MAG: hypothetical protein HYY30_03865 [Chloroflexi bacterium]|nr:hypothetical protein [Chloroflexota bacterium]
MRTLVYLAGTATIFDGIMHLLFPDRWDALWVEETRRVCPCLGNLFVRWYREYPAKRRMQGLFWIALGALILWGAGPAEESMV